MACQNIRHFAKQSYSHLFNKRGDTLIDYDFFPPSTHISTLQIYWFLRFFNPPLLVYCSYVLLFFQKITPSTLFPTSSFINSGTFAPPPHLFQPPRLLERWEYKTTLSSKMIFFYHFKLPRKQFQWSTEVSFLFHILTLSFTLSLKENSFKLDIF